MEEVLTEGLMHATAGRLFIEKGLKACAAAEAKLAPDDAQWDTYRYLREHLTGHRKVIWVLLDQENVAEDWTLERQALLILRLPFMYDFVTIMSSRSAQQKRRGRLKDRARTQQEGGGVRDRRARWQTPECLLCLPTR